MSNRTSLGQIDRAGTLSGALGAVRVLVPVGWVLASVGYFGPWIAHATAGLTLSGVDMGEFVKFLPGVLDGTLAVTRQLFYWPPFAVAVSIALLVGSPRLAYPWLFRVLALLLAFLVSLQLLPPAWSPASVIMAEFRLQTMALGLSWLLLAGFWLWGRLPSWLTGSLSTGLAIAAIGLSAWQFSVVKAAIDGVYGVAPPIGWGFPLCLVGLAALATGSALFVLRSQMQKRGSWLSR